MKLPGKFVRIKKLRSPPSRGAWIEIVSQSTADTMTEEVAPLAGGVD